MLLYWLGKIPINSRAILSILLLNSKIVFQISQTKLLKKTNKALSRKYLSINRLNTLQKKLFNEPRYTQYYDSKFNLHLTVNNDALYLH